MNHGTVQEQYHYDAFGKPFGDELETDERGYNGKPYDAVLGHYNYGFRDYDPMTGRFATVDPVRDGRNWYVYTANDPVNFIDPWGLAAEDGGIVESKHAVGTISDLGPYGDPRHVNGPIITGLNGPPRINTRIYEDYRGIEGIAENLSRIDSHENGYGRLGAYSGPNIVEAVTNFRKGKAFLVTYDNPKTDGLDGHEVFLIDKPDPQTGIYPNKPPGDPLPKNQAHAVLQNRPNLVESALSEDRRSLFKKFVDWLF